MKKYLVDANVFLRFLLADQPLLAKKAEAIFQEAKEDKRTLFCPQIVIFEIIFVLEKVYHFDKTRIIGKIQSLLATDYIQVEAKEIFIKALNIYKTKNIEFVDTFLFALAKTHDYQLL